MWFKIGLFLLFLFFSKNVNAQVVINEIFPNPSGVSSEPTEFIELFNLNNYDLDLSNYTLEDASGKIFVISQTISANGYLSFTRAQTGIALNNSGGEEVLFKDLDGNILDSYAFDKTTEDKSFSRYPNGSGDFQDNTVPTQNSANNPPPSPTPSPTPVPTSTPTPIPTPTPSPTSTPIPTTISTNTPVQTTLKFTEKNLPTQKLETDEEEPAQFSNEPLGFDSNLNKDNPSVLGINTSSKRFPKAAIIMIAGGVGFIALAVYIIFRKKK